MNIANMILIQSKLETTNANTDALNTLIEQKLSNSILEYTTQTHIKTNDIAYIFDDTSALILSNNPNNSGFYYAKAFSKDNWLSLEGFA